MKGVSSQMWVVFFLLQSLWMGLKVFLGCIAGGRLALFASLCALKGDDANLTFFLSHFQPPRGEYNNAEGA